MFYKKVISIAVIFAFNMLSFYPSACSLEYNKFDEASEKLKKARDSVRNAPVLKKISDDDQTFIRSMETTTGPIEKTLTLKECVRYALLRSFEVSLAKLDLYIAETDIMYSKAVFDTYLYGGAGYSEDKRQRLSGFDANDGQINNYYAGISNVMPTGTELNAELTHTRLWNHYRGGGPLTATGTVGPPVIPPPPITFPITLGGFSPSSLFTSYNPSHTSELTLSARQPLGKNGFGYVDRGNITLAKLAVKNADLQTQDDIEALIAGVEDAYWQLVYAKRNLEIYEGMLERAKELHETNKKNFDMGLIEKVDLLASEANVSTREAEILIIRNSYKRSEEDLKLIMNVTENIDLIPAEKLSCENIKEGLPDCLKTAFDNRRDYKAMARDIEIKGLNLNIKKNEKWPEIDLVGSMAMNAIDPSGGTSFAKSFSPHNSYYYAGVEVNVPFENRAAKSEYLKAKYEKESSIVQFKQVERSIITEVGNAYRAVVAYEKSLVFSSEAVKLQTEKLTEEDKRFQYGRSNTKNLIDYQSDLLRAELEEAVSLRNYKQAKVGLDRSMNIILGKYEGLL